ncbi:hypothetical protein LCGC14_0019300 [marine sediment metagenome]|uniref:Uncharacterized protein n=1 Tax=marine sediment metagenome TaxID=412755 RepID=A0A0F9Z2U2_9ZZZZ|nr:hypothetical protein [Phycisphaerae bacterium]HDZ42707.1 hypothetical protein [Phycisphaerae bacterium]
MIHRTPWTILLSVVLLAAIGCGDSLVQDKQQSQRGDDAYLWAFDRIEPPETFPPHPRLFLNQTEIDALKAGIAADRAFRELVDAHLAELRPLAKSPALPTREIGDNLDIAKQAASFAVAYVLTDEAIFAEAAAAILKRYVEVFPSYKPTHIKGLATSAALEECVWAVDAAAAYDLIYNSGFLTEADKQAIEQTVFRASAEVLRRCNHAVRSNWRIRAVAGVAAMGFAIGDRELIDEALNGIRDDDGRLLRDGFVQHMAWSLLADGIYYERSQSYSEECGDAFAHVLEAARHSGIDLWNRPFEGSPHNAGADPGRHFGPSRPKTVRHAYDAVLYRSFGNGTLAKMANSYWDHLKRRDGWSAAWRAYGDDRYAWPLVCDPDGWLHDLRDLLFIPPKLPTGSIDFATDTQLGVTGRHENACTLLPNGGYAILRQDASRDAVSAAITFGDFPNGHSQADQLSIVVYAGGRHVLPDTKYFRYIDQHLTWSKQTITHNTVTVDELSQYPQGDSDDMWISPTKEKPLRGRAVFFHAGDDLKAVRAECNEAYDGVGYDRTIALVDSVVVDFFRCRSDAQHQYDYALHVDGTLADCSAPLGEPQPGPLAESYGYRHIVDLRRAAVDDQRIDLTHNTDDGAETLLHTTVLPAGKVELITGNGIEGLENERAEVVIIRKRARNADFVSVIAPAAGADGPLAVGPVDNLPDGVLGVEITKPDGSKTIILSAETSRTFSYKGRKITGQLALLRIAADGAVELIDAVP